MVIPYLNEIQMGSVYLCRHKLKDFTTQFDDIVTLVKDSLCDTIRDKGHINKISWIKKINDMMETFDITLDGAENGKTASIRMDHCFCLLVDLVYLYTKFHTTCVSSIYAFCDEFLPEGVSITKCKYLDEAENILFDCIEEILKYFISEEYFVDRSEYPEIFIYCFSAKKVVDIKEKDIEEKLLQYISNPIDIQNTIY